MGVCRKSLFRNCPPGSINRRPGSVTLFEKTPISQALSLADDQTDLDDLCKQLILFN